MDQGITVFHKDETFQQKQKEVLFRKPRRGPLCPDESIALIRICEQRAKYTEITEYGPKFWTGIQVELERKIGRSYSYYSCRRRITDYIAQRIPHREAFKSGNSPPCGTMDPEVCRYMDLWIHRNDLDEQLKREHALGQLVAHDPEVATSKKVQRVAEWLKSLPDFETPAALTPPSTNSFPLSTAKDRNLAYWHEQRMVEHSRNNIRATELQLFEKQLASSRALLPGIDNPSTPTPQVPGATQVLAGVKRLREDDDLPPIRAGPRPQTQLTDLDSIKPVLKQSPGNSQVLAHPENPPFQSTIDMVFSKFWDNMLPYFRERALKEGLSITKSESIMHELFKDVGSALTRAFMKLEQDGRPSTH